MICIHIYKNDVAYYYSFAPSRVARAHIAYSDIDDIAPSCACVSITSLSRIYDILLRAAFCAPRMLMSLRRVVRRWHYAARAKRRARVVRRRANIAAPRARKQQAMCVK